MESVAAVDSEVSSFSAVERERAAFGGRGERGVAATLRVVFLLQKHQRQGDWRVVDACTRFWRDNVCAEPAMADVLIVDDIADVADSFAELLTLFGHHVRVAYCATQAMIEIGLSVPDVALLDLNMPVVDGVQLARQIRRQYGPGIRLVAHTALPRANVVGKMSEAGFDSFVSKSAQPLELALAIQGRRGVCDLRSTRFDRRSSLRASSALRRSSDRNRRFAA